MAGGLTLLDRVRVWRATGCGITLSPESLDRLAALLVEERRACERMRLAARRDRLIARIYLLLGVAAFVGSTVVTWGGF